MNVCAVHRVKGRTGEDEHLHTDLYRRLDILKWNKFHTVVTMALGIGWLLDSFEVTIVGNVMGVFKNMWHLSSVQESWILSIWFLGLMVGAYFFGYLADRFGRKRLFLTTLVFYGVFTLLTAVAWNYQALLITRFFTAIGVGAEYSAINAAISEFIPSRHRGKANATVMNFWSLGSIFAALVTLYFINVLPPNLGWRVGFGFGAVVALSTAIVRKYIPESPRWLILQGESVEAERIVGGIEQGQVFYHKSPSLKSEGIRSKSNFFRQTKELVTKYPGRTLLGALLDFSEAAGYYGMFAFLPIFILPAVHIGPTFTPVFYLIGNVGALIGGLIVASMLERQGRKLTVPVFYVLAALGVLLLAVSASTHNWLWVLGAFTLANLFGTGSWISAYPTFSEIFPTHLRSTGIGLSVGFGRIGAFTAPLILTWIANKWGLTPALIALSGSWLIGVVAMIPWCFRGVEGRGRPLEQLVQRSESA